METIDKNAEHEQSQEHNGCIGNPITNMLITSAQAFQLGAAESPCFVNSGQQPGDADHGYMAEELAGGEPPQAALDEVEALFEELQGKIEQAMGQVRATDERTAHLVLVSERLSRGMSDAHEKLDRLINHFKVA